MFLHLFVKQCREHATLLRLLLLESRVTSKEETRDNPSPLTPPHHITATTAPHNKTMLPLLPLMLCVLSPNYSLSNQPLFRFMKWLRLEHEAPIHYAAPLLIVSSVVDGLQELCIFQAAATHITSCGHLLHFLYIYLVLCEVSVVVAPQTQQIIMRPKKNENGVIMKNSSESFT